MSIAVSQPTREGPGLRVASAHSVHLVRARDPEGVKRFVQAVRYPIHKQAIDIVGEGLRGWGQPHLRRLGLGLSVPEYLQKADA